MADAGNMYEAAAKLIEQAPPGQVREVIEDLQIITSNPQQFMPLALKHLATYNLAQFQVIPSTDGSGGKTILSQAALINNLSPSSTALTPSSESGHTNGDPSRYVDPVAKRSFKVEHAQLGTQGVQDHIIPDDHEAFRSALNTSISAYLTAHYSLSDSACAVFCSSPAVVKKVAPVTEIAVEKEAESEVTQDAGADVVEPGSIGVEASTKVVEDEKSTEDIAKVSSGPTPGLIDETGEKDATTNDSTAPVASSILATVTDTISDVKEAILGSNPTQEESSTTMEEATTTLPVKPTEPEEQNVDKSVPTGPIEVAGSDEKVDTTGDAAADSNDLVANEGGAADAIKESVGGVIGQAKEAVKEETMEPVVEQDPVYTLQIVGNKYNQNNFWTGRWRSEYIVDPTQATITGSIKVDVHYFEQGNVQLAASHTPSFPYPASATTPQEAASEIVTTISRLEQAYQSRLNETYSELGEKAFRSLRRALPITRQKVDWDKIGNYKLGGQIGK